MRCPATMRPQVALVQAGEQTWALHLVLHPTGTLVHKRLARL